MIEDDGESIWPRHLASTNVFHSFQNLYLIQNLTKAQIVFIRNQLGD